MNHSEAIQQKIAERYLLGELNAEERDRYEEHFFGCTKCASEVMAGAVFMDNAKSALAAEKPATPAAVSSAREQRWFSWFLRPAFLVPAMALLLIIATYQGTIVIPRLESALTLATAPHAISSFSLIAENSRGGSPLTVRVPANKSFTLYLDIPPGTQFPYYDCELQTESGSPEFSVRVSAAEARETVQLLVPPSRLSAGKHFLVVRGSESSEGNGGAKSEVARFSFTLDFVK
jgi:Putative zinc-finger